MDTPSSFLVILIFDPNNKKSDRKALKNDRNLYKNDRKFFKEIDLLKLFHLLVRFYVFGVRLFGPIIVTLTGSNGSLYTHLGIQSDMLIRLPVNTRKTPVTPLKTLVFLLNSPVKLKMDMI